MYIAHWRSKSTSLSRSPLLYSNVVLSNKNEGNTPNILVLVHTATLFVTGYSLQYNRSQKTVENCIGGHVNVLSDYKKT